MLVLLAVGAAAAVILLSNSGSGQTSSYRQKLSGALGPLVAANQSLSTALQAVDGSHKTILAAENATAQTQSALVGVRGAASVLSAPSSDTTLSQQVQQALTNENGYLQAISSTLSNPASQSASQVQTLDTSTQSALVPIASVAPGAASSLSGTDNLMRWVAGASAAAQSQTQAAQRKAVQQAAAKASSGSQQAQAAASPSGSPSGLSACDQNISVNSRTSCQFGDNVFFQYAQDVQQAGAPGTFVVTAFSPATGQNYDETCSYNPSNQIVLCSHGSDLVQFPYWAAEVYQPG